jgi:Ran GTPase-activating protein (RanGAP) involved in mRNA processing and transport
MPPKEKKKGKKAAKIKCLQNSAKVEKGCSDVCDVDLVNVEPSELELLADHIAHCPRIRDLNILTQGTADDKHLDAVIRKIGQSDLRGVCLNCHGLGPKSIKSLGKTLRKCQLLRHLDLAHNSLGPEGLKNLNLKLCEGIRHINLYFNMIGNPGAQDLASMFQGGRHRSLHSLVLDYNEIGAPGMEALCTCLEAGDIPHLLELSLANNCLKDRGAIALAKTIQKGVCLTLHKFNLAYNSIEITGCRQLAEAIIAVRNWHHPPHLNLIGNNMSSQTIQDLQHAHEDGQIHDPHIGTVKTQLSSPPKAYRRKKPDTGQQRAEKLFTRWVKGEFELTESTPQEDIKMLLQYVGVKPAITVGKRVHLAQLIEAFSQLPLLRPTESKELLWVKNKVMDGVKGCYRLPPILGQGNGVPNRFQIAYIKKVFGTEHGGDDAVFPDSSKVGSPLCHVQRPKPSCNTAKDISTKTPVFFDPKSGMIEVLQTLKL